MKRVLMLAALLALPAARSEALGDAAPGDAMRGQQIYESRCIACHSPDANRVGPMHRGVFGRKAGSLADYIYSKALKGSDFVWNDQTLDQWLTNPQAFVPGQKMNFKVAKPEDRADLIAYLKTLK
jgi:cytochrome c